MKDMQIKIELPPEAIKITFLNAIQEVEALREFYTMYRDTWTKSKLAFEQQYATALEINDAIEKILDSEEPENEYLHIKESNVGESKFDDIIELHIRRDDQSVRVSYSMKKSFLDQDPQKARDQKHKYNQQAVYALLTKIYPNRMPMEAIRDWPLFIDFRKSKEYGQFVSEHKQDFNVYTFETSDIPKPDELADIVCDEA